MKGHQKNDICYTLEECIWQSLQQCVYGINHDDPIYPAYVAKNWFCGIQMLQVVNIYFCDALRTYFKESDVANCSSDFLTLKLNMATTLANKIGI